MRKLTISDGSGGVSAEDLPHLFTPYFTTKSGGSGLGLPTSQRLIQEHGGTIPLHSDAGVGTDFTITLPKGNVADTD